ncbi:MAG: Holliday junction resolvase RuvX [bacterium]|nr:Holliday junction resolvase RuvX [bacterium]
MGTVLAIDYGSVRVGLAITDTDQKFALALKTVPAEPRNECFEAIRRVANNERVERILLGLPLSLDGQEGPQASIVRSFGNELTNNLGLPLEFVDERFSTKSSAMAARMKGMKSPDAEAARLLLETWLEKNRKR